MSASDDDSTNRLIESAMERLSGRNPPSGQSAPSPELRLGRRDYDRALQQRLEQLRAAMGEDEASPPPAPGTPMQPTPSAPAPRPQANGYGPATLLLVAIASGIAGAGAMRLSMETSAPSLPAAAQPPRPITLEAAPAAAQTPAPAPAISPAPAPAATAAPSAVLPDTAEADARKLIESWRQAWSRRDIEAYLACYSPDFTPANGQSRSEWAASRRKNLLGRPSLSLELHDLKIEAAGERQLKATFLQDYVSGAYQEKARPKTLLLIRQGNDWTIAREEQAGAPGPSPGTTGK